MISTEAVPLQRRVPFGSGAQAQMLLPGSTRVWACPCVVHDSFRHPREMYLVYRKKERFSANDLQTLTKRHEHCTTTTTTNQKRTTRFNSHHIGNKTWNKAFVGLCQNGGWFIALFAGHENVRTRCIARNGVFNGRVYLIIIIIATASGVGDNVLNFGNCFGNSSRSLRPYHE